MDANVMFTEEKRAERVLEALRSNRMEAYFVKTSEEAAAVPFYFWTDGFQLRRFH